MIATGRWGATGCVSLGVLVCNALVDILPYVWYRYEKTSIAFLVPNPCVSLYIPTKYVDSIACSNIVFINLSVVCSI